MSSAGVITHPDACIIEVFVKQAGKTPAEPEFDRVLPVTFFVSSPSFPLIEPILPEKDES